MIFAASVFLDFSIEVILTYKVIDIDTNILSVILNKVKNLLYIKYKSFS